MSKMEGVQGKTASFDTENTPCRRFEDRSYFHYTKADWRLWAKAWRNSFMSGTFQASTRKTNADAQIASLLDAVIQSTEKHLPSLNIAIYLPTQGEVDLTDLYVTCLDRGHTLLAPRVVGKAQLAWHGVSQFPQEVPDLWQQSHFGIWEPKASLAVFDALPHVVLVPCLMADFKGFRLGYGGGFYDAQLKQWQADAKHLTQAPPLSVGVLYQESIIRALPVDGWDVPLDAYMSEAGLVSDTRNPAF
jgi:5-formyltetrahydrofolate cyclo-ligase